MKRLFIFGLGYAGVAIARAAIAKGYDIAGTVTTAAKADELKRGGIAAELFGQPGPALAAATHILATIPPTETGDPAVPLCTAGRPAWIGYLSTTGVYGDAQGGWVDETTPPAPTQPRSQRRLAAEQAWQALGIKFGAPVHLFRLPAIYGPGRSALDQVRAGTARRVDKPGQVFSRIHVADIAAAVLASMERPAPTGAIYNVADDEPASQADVIALAATLLGLPVPPLIAWDEAASALGDMARSFYAESRRVRAERIKHELGVVLKYPSYRQGLRAIATARPPTAP